MILSPRINPGTSRINNRSWCQENRDATFHFILGARSGIKHYGHFSGKGSSSPCDYHLLKTFREMIWWHISAILCAYGFFKEFRPSEPFISPYLTSFKNFTIEQVNREIYPVGTYVYLSVLILVFLLTDFLRYKPVLLAGSISAVITWCLLIWGNTIPIMQAVEFFYGVFLASEIAYYTYIYAKVDKKHYQKVTSHTRAAFLLGKAISGILSQVLITVNINYLQLNYFSVFGVGVTVPIAICLPSVSQSIYFHRKEESDVSANEKTEYFPPEEGVTKKEEVPKAHCKVAFQRLYKDFKQAFTNLYVLKWSIWWAFTTAGYLQAISYIQLVWEDIIKDTDATLYHGYIEFIFAVSGAIVAFGVGYLNISWEVWGEIFLGIFTIAQGGLLFYTSYIYNLYVSYLVFVIYRNLYESAITVATYEVAKHINKDSYALVFGVNTFAALVLQTILTAIVINLLNFDIRTQFRIYGDYLLGIGAVFAACGIVRLFYKKVTSKS